jgi:hypothetical protein
MGLTMKPPTNEATRFVEESFDTAWIEEEIRLLPSLDPPRELARSIMGAVQQRRFPWWLRLYRWARSPRRIVFTPLQAASFAAALALVLVAGAQVRFWQATTPQQTVVAGVPGPIPVRLELSMPQARSVAVVGSFNSWQGEGYEMVKDQAEGSWILVLKLPAGRYEYAFLLDGEKLLADPQTSFLQDDGFGNQNAVLIVGNGNEQAI